jgi:hypothetical protein
MLDSVAIPTPRYLVNCPFALPLPSFTYTVSYFRHAGVGAPRESTHSCPHTIPDDGYDRVVKLSHDR